jgi:hypothetical protein
MELAVFWVVAPCRLVRVYQRFGGLYCLYHQGDDNGGPDDGGSTDLQKRLINSYQFTRRYNPEDNHLKLKNCFKDLFKELGIKRRDFNHTIYIALSFLSIHNCK